MSPNWLRSETPGGRWPSRHLAGTHLDYAQVRHLSSSHQKAEDSALGFVRWVIVTFGVTSAALEETPQEQDTRSAVLHRLIMQTFREAGVSIWTVGKQQLFDAYAIPAVKNRRELRAIAASCWPILISRGDGLCLDATALGRNVETERLLLT